MQRLQVVRYSAETLRHRSVALTSDSSSRLSPSLYFRMSYKRTIRPRAHAAEESTCNIASLIALGALALSQESSTVKCDDGAKDDGSESKSAPVVDEDCPFCRFFLGGPCRDEFIQWHTCVQTSEKATDCMVPFRPLKTCMDENGISMGEETNDEEESK